MNKINKKNIIILIIIIIIIFSLILYYMNMKNEEEFISYNTETEENKINNEMINNKGEEKESQEIIIHITGSVVNQGIVKLKENSRVSDAIEAAGGTLEDADLSKINLAFVLEDGMKIYIPKYNDEQNTEENKITETTNVSESKDKTTNIKININTANQSEFEKLPGIGISTAKKIISYRNENGKFKSIEDIKNVKGIGTSKFEQIKEFIYIK